MLTVACALVLGSACTVYGQVAAPTNYAQHLAEQLLRCDAGLQAVELNSGPLGSELHAQALRASDSAVDRPAPWCPHAAEGRSEALAEAGAASHTMPLADSTGAMVGRLTLTWRAPAAGTLAHAGRLRDAVSRRILGLGNLADRYPFVDGAGADTQAQALVEQLLREHSQTAVIAIRAPAPGTGELTLLGSSFGRHGKRADGDDLKVLQASQPITGTYGAGRRFGVDLALRDLQGRAWGTLNVGYALRADGDAQAQAAAGLERALALRQAIEARVGDGAAQLGMPTR